MGASRKRRGPRGRGNPWWCWPLAGWAVVCTAAYLHSMLSGYFAEPATVHAQSRGVAVRLDP